MLRVLTALTALAVLTALTALTVLTAQTVLTALTVQTALTALTALTVLRLLVLVHQVFTQAVMDHLRGSDPDVGAGRPRSAVSAACRRDRK